jgi:hypothetical protein
MPTLAAGKKGKKKPSSPPPSTVLTITLNTDGTGSLITKRGELATLSSFTYRRMEEIIVAIQQGAVHLVELEKNPPPKELSSVIASTTPGQEPVGTPDTTEQDDAAPDEALSGIADTAAPSTLAASTPQIPGTSNTITSTQLSLL